eukprot:jgi/Picsp_1/1581/NSC_05059-R1_protein
MYCCGGRKLLSYGYPIGLNGGVLKRHQGKIDESRIRRIVTQRCPSGFLDSVFYEMCHRLHACVLDGECREQSSKEDASEYLINNSIKIQRDYSRSDSFLMDFSLLSVCGLLVGVLGPALPADAAVGFVDEPSNALSLPTWAVHTSSVFEWGVGMYLMWKYGEVSGNPRWKGMAWGMLPCLGSAMCACTWHFYYNSTDVQFLVALQAFLTVVGNFTCWIAAYRIYQGSQEA